MFEIAIVVDCDLNALSAHIAAPALPGMSG